MNHTSSHGKPRPDRSSIELLHGVRMRADMRALAIVQMRRSQALVDLAACAAAGIAPKLHRLSRSARHRALVLKRTVVALAGRGRERKTG
jgi:hypothetical protein